MKDLNIQTVANGWIVRLDGPKYQDPRILPSELFVFSTPAQLTLWIEKWSVERRKEQTTK